MAISQVGGTSNQSTVGVTTLSATYSPTTGNTLVLFLNTSTAITALTVKDSANNPLTAGPTVGNLVCFYQVSVPAGITSYTANWTTSAQCSIAVEEYSGAAAINTVGNTNTTNNTSATVSLTISQPNNWVVAGMGSANTLTTTVGNQRQQTTTSTARIVLQDNTSAAVGSVTNTATLTSAVWTAIAIELGGLGKTRDNEDLALVATLPTSSKARVNEDLALVATSVTSSKARVNETVLLVAYPYVPFVPSLYVHIFDDPSFLMPAYNQGIAQIEDGDGWEFAANEVTNYLIVFVVT